MTALASPPRWCRAVAWPELTAATSEVTGRLIHRNDSTDVFAVLPDADLGILRTLASEATQEVEVRLAEITCAQQRTAYRRALSIWEGWTHIRDADSAAEYIHALVSLSKEPVMSGSRKRVCAFLTRLWGENVVAWPQDRVWAVDPRFFFDTNNLRRHAGWLLRMMAPIIGDEKEDDIRASTFDLLRRARTLAGVESVGDLSPSTIGSKPLFRRFYRRRYLLLTMEQTTAHPEQAGVIEGLWPTRLKRTRRKNDRTFAWTREAYPDLSDWIDRWKEWCAIGMNRNATSAGDLFLRYLIAHPAITRNPDEYCQRSYRCPIAFAESSIIKDWKNPGPELNKVSAFFDWFLDVYASAPDDYGERIRFKGFFNPVARVSFTTEHDQTHRVPMPMRYMREMIQIIVENDFAWPKKLGGDYFLRQDPAGGPPIRTWSPVTACVALVKLSLPLRTFQGRALESSEGDDVYYVIDAKGQGQWVEKDGATPMSNKTRRGVLRRFQQPGQSDITGFFINTNKTADRAPNEQEKGYEIFWENQVAIRAIAKLEQFQRDLNPCPPQEWTALDERCFSAGVPRPHAAHFLTRDPCSRHHPNQPISDSKVQYFWRRLNQELQARLDARGVTDDDDKPIRVVEDKPGIKKSAQRALFDLHSTRVSILSALATEGGVPLAILSKCVAGHASIVMTLYYIKPGQTQINKTLQEASARLEDKEVENFKRLVREHAANKTKTIPIAVVSNAAGVDALDPKTSAGWIYSDIGMCPVGGTMCSQGGEKSDLDRGYRPVPGGARNCPSCRFFITGPAFIGGLEARFNAASFGCKEIGARRLAALKAMERFQDELFDAEVSQRPKEEIKVLRKRFDAAQDHFEQAHAQHDQALHDWHRLTALMNRCWQAVRSVQESEKQSDGAAQPLALVLSGTTADLASAVHLTSDWELTQRVCEASILYPVAETPVAVMRRAQILDRFLARADSAPVFSQLSDADSLTMANQFVALLHARLGPKRVDHLMSGTSAPTLEDRRALAAALGGKARMTAPLDAPAALLLPQESEAA